jgi:peptidoglycan/LPS O-acetylase OafA/YrhL
VAVLGVIVYHLHFGWAGGGLLGVGVFFVLSGYLITDLLVAAIHGRGMRSFGQFWLRRARRLLPALFVMLLTVVAWATLFDRSQLPALRSDTLPAVFYFSNWWYIFHHVSYFARYGPPSPLGHLWSLAIEEQFYLVWPFALLLAIRSVRDRRMLVAGTLVLAAASAVEMALLFVPYTDPTRVYDGTDTRAFELLIGAALAFVMPRGRSFSPLTARGRAVLEAAGGAALVGIILLFCLTGQYDAFVYQGGMVLLSLLSAALIAACVHPGLRVGRVLGVTPLRWIGERSYGMYLWTVPVIVLTTPAGASQSLLRDALQVAGIVAVSELSWRYVEQPVRHGALERLWRRGRERWQRRDWSRLVPGTQGWATSGAVCAGALICSLGLSGVISGPETPPDATKSILPPRHHLTKPSSSTTATTTPAGEGVTVIGDSIMVDAAPYLQQMLPGAVIDAQVGQQLYQAQASVPQLKAAGDIGNRLVLELGTNGYFNVTQLDALLRSLGPMQRIVLVNTRETRPWEQAVNQTIATVASSYPHTTMVNWFSASAGTPQYFEPDGVHLDPQGAQFYATLLVKALEAPQPARHRRRSQRHDGAGPA